MTFDNKLPPDLVLVKSRFFFKYDMLLELKPDWDWLSLDTNTCELATETLVEDELFFLDNTSAFPEVKVVLRLRPTRLAASATDKLLSFAINRDAGSALESS